MCYKRIYIPNDALFSYKLNKTNRIRIGIGVGTAGPYITQKIYGQGGPRGRPYIPDFMPTLLSL